MMKINILPVKKLIGSSQSFSFTASAAALALSGTTAGSASPFCDAGPVFVEGQVVNNGQSLEVRGQIRAKVSYACSRCLEEFERDVDAAFSERYLEKPLQETVDTDAGEISYYDGDEIEITELVRESLLLSEPLQPVCNEDCCGLCPECGVNLNMNSCSCRQQVIDPRLMILQKLVKT